MERKLQISDLSIGDWVMVKGKAVKVESLGKIRDYVEIEGSLALFHIKAVQPIPITPEILDKNGFVKRNTYIWNNPKMRCTAYRFGRKYWDIRVTYRARDYRPTRINIENIVYVHELQHELRLAGVEKEIEL